MLKGSKQGKKKGDLTKEWGQEQQQAFIKLLGAFETAPLLRYYDPKRPYRLETDALDVALSGILS